jgi:hypothetical protein
MWVGGSSGIRDFLLNDLQSDDAGESSGRQQQLGAAPGSRDEGDVGCQGAESRAALW